MHSTTVRLVGGRLAKIRPKLKAKEKGKAKATWPLARARGKGALVLVLLLRYLLQPFSCVASFANLFGNMVDACSPMSGQTASVAHDVAWQIQQISVPLPRSRPRGHAASARGLCSNRHTEGKDRAHLEAV